MELELKEKALEDLKSMLRNNFEGVDRIYAIKGVVIKANGDISNVRFTEYDLDKEVCRMNARSLIDLLIDETELVEVRGDIEEDGSTMYTFKLACASRMLALELLIDWKDKRDNDEASKHNK